MLQKKDSNLCWEKKDIQVLCYIFQQFIQVVVVNFKLIDLIYYNLLSKMNWISNYRYVDQNVIMSSRMQKVICGATRLSCIGKGTMQWYYLVVIYLAFY